MRELYRHRSAANCMDWANKPRVLAISHGHMFRVMQVTTGPNGEWAAEVVMEEVSKNAHFVRQVLLHPNGSLVLISTRDYDSLWSVAENRKIAERTCSVRDRKLRKWLHRSPTQLALAEDQTTALFGWFDLEQHFTAEYASEFQSHKIHIPNWRKTIVASTVVDVDDIVVLQNGQIMYHPDSVAFAAGTTRVLVLNLESLESSQHAGSEKETSPSPGATPAPPEQHVADITDLDYIVGLVRTLDPSRLVFICRNGWVCSVGLSGPIQANSIRKHFFIPTSWRTRDLIFIAQVRQNGDVIFVQGDGIVVVKNGLGDGYQYSLAKV